MRRILAAALLAAAPFGAQAGEPLSAAEARQLLAGNSTRGSIVLASPLLGHVYERFFAADGRLFSRNLTKNDGDAGVWRVDDGGNVCMKHTTWASGREYCTQIERTGTSSYTRVFKGEPSELMTVRPGDAFGLGG